MTEELRDLRRLEDESLDVACLVDAESLHDLWNKEERELDWMLLQNTHSVLEQKRVVAIPGLKIHQSRDRWNSCPHWEPLGISFFSRYACHGLELTFKRPFEDASSLSPKRKCRASGTSTTNRGSPRTSLVISACTVGSLNLSPMCTATAGEIFQARSNNLLHSSCMLKSSSVVLPKITHEVYRSLQGSSVGSSIGLVHRIAPYAQSVYFVLEKQLQDLHSIPVLVCVFV